MAVEPDRKQTVRRIHRHSDEESVGRRSKGTTNELNARADVTLGSLERDLILERSVFLAAAIACDLVAVVVAE